MALCISCDLNFKTDADSFVVHMSENHPTDCIECTLCSQLFDGGLDYSMHFIQKHMTEIYNEKAVPIELSSPIIMPCSSSMSPNKLVACPVCDALYNIKELNQHANYHFEAAETRLLDSEDYLLAKKLEREEFEERRKFEENDFMTLQKKYGMDENGSYKQQGVIACENAYSRGKLTLSQLYDEKQRISVNQLEGIEDPGYAVSNVIENIKELSRRSPDVLDSYFCTAVDFYGTSPADAGFGCGYRNIQMLLSSLKHCECYRKALFKNGPVHIPSIPKMQKLIETAWAQGFDRLGKEQLNGKLHDTRKWIGATEACCMLSSFRIKTLVVDFWQPSSSNNCHPAMLKWVYDYFKERRDFTLPLYFQHEGHSRTIIGVERTRSGLYNLLIFDPSISRSKILALSKSSNVVDLKCLRKSLKDLRRRQFQIVSITGLMQSDEEYEISKFRIDNLKIPPKA